METNGVLSSINNWIKLEEDKHDGEEEKNKENIAPKIMEEVVEISDDSNEENDGESETENETQADNENEDERIPLQEIDLDETEDEEERGNNGPELRFCLTLNQFLEVEIVCRKNQFNVVKTSVVLRDYGSDQNIELNQRNMKKLGLARDAISAGVTALMNEIKIKQTVYIGERIFITFKPKYKNCPIDIRRYETSEPGKMRATTEGLYMTVEEWNLLSNLYNIIHVKMEEMKNMLNQIHEEMMDEMDQI